MYVQYNENIENGAVLYLSTSLPDPDDQNGDR